jgi:ribosome-associated heat shock protein Hsp15
MVEDKKLRIDKYLWAIRLFKTRSISAAACNDGRVRLNDTAVKASKVVIVGDVFQINFESKKTTIKVLQLLQNRVGAALVNLYYEDLTPPEEIERRKEKQSEVFFFNSGAGKRGNKQARPTKKVRRTMSDFREDI